jgi:hypothetical protein
VASEFGVQLLHSRLQLFEALCEHGDRPLMGHEHFLLLIVLGTERGVLPLQFVDAIVAPITCHDRRTLRVRRHFASKQTCSGMESRIR